MNKLIAIIAGEPNSINSEIIAKSWKYKKKLKKVFIIGNFNLLKKQFLKLRLKVPLVKINRIDDIEIKEKLFVLDVPLKFESSFKVNFFNTKDYVTRSLNLAHKLAINKKIHGFINAPIDKKIFNNKYLGVTEYLASKNKIKNREVMLIYNKKLSVVPLTTHVDIKNVTKKITLELIKKKMTCLHEFYYKVFKKKPRICILGLNPHNSENKLNSIENKIIRPAVIQLKNKNININGPFPADTAFNEQNTFNYDVIVGMYHDQVLAPFKALYGFDAINLTLGLKYLRLSPDHGTAQDIVGLNKGNPKSLITAINFLYRIND